MSATPALDAKGFVDDERYAAYKHSLLERREKLESALINNGHLDYPSMCRLAGEIRGIDYALGLPEVLKRSDPNTPTTP